MAQQLNDYLSEKLKALSLAAIVLVVFIHSHNEEVKFASGEMAGNPEQWVLFVENFVSKGIARIAAPIFFMISGLLFFLSYDFTLQGIVSKFKSRLKSLVVPYLIWSVFGLILILSLQLIPWSKDFFTKELIIHYSISKLLRTIFFDPIPYQLWFIRDLFMLVIVSPLIWYLTKSLRGVLLAILMVLWTIAPKTFSFFTNEALLFFTLGCALALDKKLLNHIFSEFWSYYFFLSWLMIVLAATYLLTFHPEMDVVGLTALNNLGIVTGILAVWSCYDHIDHAQVTKYSVAFGYTFIIFVFHEPVLTILIKGMFFVLGKTNLSSILIYILAPLIAIAISVTVRFVLMKHAPRFYKIATGGR